MVVRIVVVVPKDVTPEDGALLRQFEKSVREKRAKK